jgi:CelD/BcsL family acetyltransferase involved in cellulose biosynthesis
MTNDTELPVPTGSAALPPGAEPPTAAHARLGSEGVLRLRARHAEVLARISERIGDSAVREELKTRAERLNPDTWVTDQEVTAGLEQYETIFASLRSILGPRRRRRPRRSSSAEGSELEASASESVRARGGDPDAEEEPRDG